MKHCQVISESPGRLVPRCAALIIWLLAVCCAQADEIEQIEFFESKIRPVLIQHCYECHSANGSEVKGGLLVDSKIGLLQGGDSGPAVVAGKPDESPLIEAMRYDGLEMPPSARLPDNVIHDFEKWVALGATDPRSDATSHVEKPTIDIEKGREFWAFQPVQDHVPPQKNSSLSPIDAFVAEGLQAAGVTPVAAATKRTLIRRMFYDLTGLPPSVDELKSALADDSETATAKLADRLLASPQFGVHWGRHWLDVARYADSNGGDFNATFHNAWKYRDYVIKSMNEDKPFDQFVKEQIAGDLLPFETDQQRRQQLIATGFLMIGAKMLSERDKEKLTMDVVDEQLSTVGSAFMGMTLGCARCHDHKFDPIPSRDYYALAGIFRSTRTLQGESQKYVSTWPRTMLPTDDAHVAEVKSYESKKKKLEQALKAAKKELTTLEKQVPTDPLRLLDDSQATVVGSWKSSTLTPGYIGKGYIHDNLEGKGEKSVEFTWLPPETAEYEVRLSYIAGSNRANNVPVLIQHRDGESEVLLDQTQKPGINGTFGALGRFTFEKGKSAIVRISNKGTVGYVIVDAIHFVPLDSEGRFAEVSASEGRESRQELLAEQKRRIESLDELLASLQKKAPRPLPQAIAVQDLPEVSDCEICIRGEHGNRGDSVARGFLQVASLSPTVEIDRQNSGRLQLAEWLTDARHPLTSRVIVNRIWQHLMGQGIVRSVDNFGQLGDRPTHPELLDHLAARFMTPTGQKTDCGADGFGWSVKALVREIILSDAYQRGTAHDPSASDVDPENRLLWKANRRRLTAESLRDAILAAGGLLDLSSGGSPVEGLGTLVKSNDANADDYQRAETNRRSVYLPIIRNELPAVLTIFDFADPDMVVGKRPVTSVPAQALFLMNSPFVMDAAQCCAQQVSENQTQSVDEVIERVYLILLSRIPDTDERRQAGEFLSVEDASESVEVQDGQPGQPPFVVRLTRLVHVMMASTEFRMLD